MKKLFCMVLALLCVVMMTACDQQTPSASVEADNSHTTSALDYSNETTTNFIEGIFDSPNTWPSEEKAEECLLGFINAKSIEEAASFATADTAEDVQNTWASFSGNTFRAEVSFAGEFEGLHVFLCKLIPGGSDQVYTTTLAIMRQQDDHYILCLQQSIQNHLVAQCLCPACNGNGQIYTGGNVCGICAGTGQQYYPNVYYDAALQMWQGQYQSCSGCAGAGHTGSNQLTCISCRGIGLILD